MTRFTTFRPTLRTATAALTGLVAASWLAAAPIEAGPRKRTPAAQPAATKAALGASVPKARLRATSRHVAKPGKADRTPARVPSAGKVTRRNDPRGARRLGAARGTIDRSLGGAKHEALAPRFPQRPRGGHAMAQGPGDALGQRFGAAAARGPARPIGFSRTSGDALDFVANATREVIQNGFDGRPDGVAAQVGRTIVSPLLVGPAVLGAYHIDDATGIAKDPRTILTFGVDVDTANRAQGAPGAQSGPRPERKEGTGGPTTSDPDAPCSDCSYGDGNGTGTPTASSEDTPSSGTTEAESTSDNSDADAETETRTEDDTDGDTAETDSTDGEAETAQTEEQPEGTTSPSGPDGCDPTADEEDCRAERVRGMLPTVLGMETDTDRAERALRAGLRREKDGQPGHETGGSSGNAGDYPFRPLQPRPSTLDITGQPDSGGRLGGRDVRSDRDREWAASFLGAIGVAPDRQPGH